MEMTREDYEAARKMARVIIEPGARRNLLALDSLHTGCQFGLCPEGGLPREQGGHYEPNIIQVKVWRMFRQMIETWLPDALHKEPFDLLILGEAIEGAHHGSTTPITNDLVQQEKMSRLILEPLIKELTDMGMERLYMTIGSRPHSGDAGCNDKSIAEKIGAIPDKYGTYARDAIKLRVGDSVVYGAHYIGGSRSPWYESTALNREYARACYAAGRWGMTLPDFMLYGHRHQYIEVRVGTHKGFGAGVIVPGWQAKTPYVVQKIDPFAVPQFGAVLIRQGDQEAYTRVWVRSIKEEPDDIE